MHSKILVNAGFYLLLLFALSITIFPPAAYLLALAVISIWLLDLLIFREPRFVDQPLFYPIIALNVFIILAWVLSRLHRGNLDLFLLGPSFVFYLAVSGFVISSEQRRMLLWTFVAGVIVAVGTALTNWWALFPVEMTPIWIGRQSMFLVALAFSAVVGFYVEALDLRERFFLGLVAIPLALTLILSLEKACIMALFLALILAALLRGGRVLIPIAFMAIAMLTVFLLVSHLFDGDAAIREYADFAVAPFKEIASGPSELDAVGFFGGTTSRNEFRPTDENQANPFFLDLPLKYGPPVFIVLLWILIARAAESFTKRRKVADVEGRSYHMAVLLLILSLFILNLYGDALAYPQVILVSWLIMGVSEI